MSEGGFIDQMRGFRSRFSSHEAYRSRIVVDLTEPNERDMLKLRERMHLANGKLAVLVHPYYPPLSSETGISSAYKDQVQTLVSSSREQHIPIAIFEEEAKASELRGHFPTLDEYFLIRTIPGDPTPATKRVKQTGRDEMDEEYEYHQQERENAFARLLAVMKSASVTDVEIGGRYLAINTAQASTVTPYETQRFAEEASHAAGMTEWVENGMVPGACVGKVMREMLKVGINVNVSEAVGPHQPSLFLDRHDKAALIV